MGPVVRDPSGPPQKSWEHLGPWTPSAAPDSKRPEADGGPQHRQAEHAVLQALTSVSVEDCPKRSDRASSASRQ
eukprot:7723833-Pyramimonas_sp.AAC.1